MSNSNGGVWSDPFTLSVPAPAYTSGPSVTAAPTTCIGQTVSLSFEANECLASDNTFTAYLLGAPNSPVSLSSVSPGPA